jgi:hypothetical protein
MTMSDELRGKIIGIDALVRNVLVVAEGETALRLIGIQELATDALSLLARFDTGDTGGPISPISPITILERTDNESHD